MELMSSKTVMQIFHNEEAVLLISLGLILYTRK